MGATLPLHLDPRLNPRRDEEPLSSEAVQALLAPQWSNNTLVALLRMCSITIVENRQVVFSDEWLDGITYRHGNEAITLLMNKGWIAHDGGGSRITTKGMAACKAIVNLAGGLK